VFARGRPHRHDLRAITSPALPSTISVDGVPRNDGGLWTEVPPGTYEVCFGAPGYVTPPCQNNQVVVASATTTVTGTYAPL
jgi:hypothetical protein